MVVETPRGARAKYQHVPELGLFTLHKALALGVLSQCRTTWSGEDVRTHPNWIAQTSGRPAVVRLRRFPNSRPDHPVPPQTRVAGFFHRRDRAALE